MGRILAKRETNKKHNCQAILANRNRAERASHFNPSSTRRRAASLGLPRAELAQDVELEGKEY